MNVHALGETGDGVAAARVTRSWRDGERSFLQMRYLLATPDGFEEAEELHTMMLFRDEEYRGAFIAADLAPDVIPSPMEGRDRYIAVRS
jgi:hypothetical protein